MSRKAMCDSRKIDHLQSLKVWQTIHRSLLVDASPWLKLWVEKICLPNGEMIEPFYTLEQPDYVEVFALDDNNLVLGLWRYKHGPRRINIGLPAGYVKPSETPLAAAQRELIEETGYEAGYWKHLGSFTVDGNRFCGQAHIYIAKELIFVNEPTPDDLEEMQIEFISLKDLRRLLYDGTVATLGAATAISLGLNFHNLFVNSKK